MVGKRWTKEEIAKLYEYASTLTVREAAQRLNRSYDSTWEEVKKLEICWAQGTWNSCQIAKEVGCSQSTAAKAIRLFFKFQNVRRGKSDRYRLSDEQAEKVINFLEKSLHYRQRFVKAGKASAQLRIEGKKEGLLCGKKN